MSTVPAYLDPVLYGHQPNPVMWVGSS